MGKVEHDKETCLTSGYSNDCTNMACRAKATSAPNTAQDKQSAITYSVLQRCSNVVPSSAGDDRDIFPEGESDRG